MEHIVRNPAVKPLTDLESGVAIREGHDNFFTPLRLIFALLVLLGHAFVIANGSLDQEPTIFFDYTFSYLAVNLFFIASGFLVTKSMLYRGDGPGFTAARLLRIYPALIVHVLFVMFVIGPLATRLPVMEFLTDPKLLVQPLLVLSFVETGMIMPGVFEGNGEPFGSAPLWTLRYEMLCYIATVLIFSLGLMRRKWMVLAQFVIPAAIWIVAQTYDLFEIMPSTIENAGRFAIAYGLGATLYAYRERIRFNWVGLAFALSLCWLFQETPALEIGVNLLLAWIVMTVAYARLPRLRALQSMPDISYGVYIYHWCVMQFLIFSVPTLSVLHLFLAALPITIALAWLSWTCVEKPMLKRKTAFGEALRFGRDRKSFDAKTVLLD